MRPQGFGRQTIAAGEQNVKKSFRRDLRRQCGSDLNAIAGGKNQRFPHTAALQELQSRRDLFGAERKFLADLNWSSAMIDAGQRELHAAYTSPRPTCVAQVISEQTRTLTASQAIRRPRQPADTLKKIMAR